MAERERRLLKSVDDVILNTLDDLKWPVELHISLVKTILFREVNNYMMLDPKDVISSEKIYEQVCRVLDTTVYKHHIHGKREWWQIPLKNYEKI